MGNIRQLQSWGNASGSRIGASAAATPTIATAGKTEGTPTGLGKADDATGQGNSQGRKGSETTATVSAETKRAITGQNDNVDEILRE